MYKNTKKRHTAKQNYAVHILAAISTGCRVVHVWSVVVTQRSMCVWCGVVFGSVNDTVVK